MKQISGLWLSLILVLLSACHQKHHELPELRVGTTGDYPPLTNFDKQKGEFTGSDIDLVRQLGRHMGKKVVFVKTSWKGLNQDLKAKKFDLAIGGISVSPERSALFIFSEPLLLDRKVALCRTADKQHYPDFNAIDQPGIRVTEGIGGTNETFARKHLKKALLNLIPDNEQTFGLLLKKEADITFTDETKARYVQKNNPDLHWIQLDERVSPPYTKAIMFNKSDTLLRSQVDNWLKERDH